MKVLDELQGGLEKAGGVVGDLKYHVQVRLGGVWQRGGRRV